MCCAFADRKDTSQYRRDFATSRIDFVMASFQCKGSHDCGHGKCIDMKEEDHRQQLGCDYANPTRNSFSTRGEKVARFDVIKMNANYFNNRFLLILCVVELFVSPRCLLSIPLSLESTVVFSPTYAIHSHIFIQILMQSLHGREHPRDHPLLPETPYSSTWLREPWRLGQL